MADDVMDAMWRRAEPTVFITREEFERNLDGWTIESYMADGDLAFATLSRGPEFHFMSFGTGAPITLRMIRGWLQPVLDRHGYVCTRTPKDEVRQQRINKAVGFVADGQDEFFIYYRLTCGVWSRSKPCQS